MFTPRSIQDLDSSYDVLSYILLQISPYTKSPYFIRRVCKGWKNLYDTGGMWMMIYKCYFAQSVPRGITHRRACNMEFQKPYEKIMSPREIELFYTSGYKKLSLAGCDMELLPEGAPCTSPSYLTRPISEGFGELHSLEELRLGGCIKLKALPAGLNAFPPACCSL